MVAWLFARSSGSEFVLRVEDLDRNACRPEHEASQRADLLVLGIGWDGPVVHQSERLDRYQEVIAALVADGHTYECFCTRREVLEAAAAPHEHLPDGAYPGTCRELTENERAARVRAGRSPARRLRADGATESFVDRVHGAYEGMVDDFVIQRNDGTPAYNLAVVVDDADAGVGEVVRGDDLLATTPRQICLARVLDVAAPTYAHVPLVLGPDGERLAKRHGAVTLADQIAVGSSVDGVRSLLASSLGLAAPDETVSMKDLVGRFDVDSISAMPWVWPAET
jgi:glutamyl-tRNA synthetase